MAVVVAAPTTTSRNRKLLNQNTPTSSSPSSPPPPAASSSSSSSTARKPLVPFSTFDTSMILTIIFLLATIFLISLFSCYVRRFSSSSPNEISRRRRRRQHRRRSTTSLQSIGSSSLGLDISTIQSLPIFSLDENAKNKDTRVSTTTTTTDCCICLSEFEESETVKVIPYCGHVFHLDCIDTWFLSHVSCPLCRSIQLFATKDGTCSLDVMVAVEPECESHQEEGSTVTSSIERETQVPPTTTTTTVGVRSISSCFELQKSSSFSEEECTLG